jgi:hypothetical protein
MWPVFSIIREALGLTKCANVRRDSGSKVIQNVILDAEMVAFSDPLLEVDGASFDSAPLCCEITATFDRILEDTKSHYRYCPRRPEDHV